MTYPGVQKDYAIHADRELRVIVESGKVTGALADVISFKMA